MGRTCSFHKQQQQRLIYFFIVVLVVVVGLGYCVAAAHQCTHGHHHDHDEEDVVGFNKKQQQQSTLLPEEIAEEEDLKLMMMMMMTSAHHDHDQHDAADDDTGFRGGLWIHAMACSLLVSLASLICLILLPFIFVQGKPSRPLVDSLALFGAGAMLGDAFLHQLPHAFGGEHSHSHDDHAHHHEHFEQSHSHSLKDLSVGLSVLAGIVLFLIVEKLVRYVEAFSGGLNVWSLGHHHHHHHKHSSKLRDDDDTHENKGSSNNAENGRLLDKISEEKEPDMLSANTESQSGQSNKDVLRKRNTQSSASEGTDLFAEKISNVNSEPINEEESIKSQSNLVFGYLNLFSDGVHNFTDGMALGSAFLLYGSVGGWSRTLFLLAHELPQEIGDFGILVRSGFSVSKALFFNFLSALVALAGTALALMWGKDPGQSSLIEGFTAGGFIYIAVAGVLAEMNNGSTALRNTIIQLISLVLGMAVALVISLVE